MDVKDVTRWRRGTEGRMGRRTYIAEFTTPRYRRLLRIKEWQAFALMKNRAEWNCANRSGRKTGGVVSFFFVAILKFDKNKHLYIQSSATVFDLISLSLTNDFSSWQFVSLLPRLRAPSPSRGSSIPYYILQGSSRRNGILHSFPRFFHRARTACSFAHVLFSLLCHFTLQRLIYSLIRIIYS